MRQIASNRARSLAFGAVLLTGGPFSPRRAMLASAGVTSGDIVMSLLRVGPSPVHTWPTGPVTISAGRRSSDVRGVGDLLDGRAAVNQPGVRVTLMTSTMIA